MLNYEYTGSLACTAHIVPRPFRWSFRLSSRTIIILQQRQEYKLNTAEKSKQRETQQNKTTLIQSPFATLGQEMRWLISTTLPNQHSTVEVVPCKSQRHDMTATVPDSVAGVIIFVWHCLSHQMCTNSSHSLIKSQRL